MYYQKILVLICIPLIFTGCGQDTHSILDVDERVVDSLNTEPEENQDDDQGPTTGTNPISGGVEPICSETFRPTCPLGKKSLEIFDQDGCDRHICVLDFEPMLASIPEHGENDLAKLPKEPNESTGEVCKLPYKGLDVRYIAPNSTHITYVRLSTSQYSPQRGRYREGRKLVCELTVITCATSKRIRRTPKQAKYLPNGAGHLCGKALFTGHPEYNYRYYKQLYNFVSDAYKTCRSRDPSRDEISIAIDQFIEHEWTEEQVVTQICEGSQ